MEYCLSTRLGGNIAMTYDFHRNRPLMADDSLYKFIWVQDGYVDLEIDHVPVRLERDQIISLSPLHRIRFVHIAGQYLSLLFNSNFYCIYGHDDEVSCNGFLFNGSSDIMLLNLTSEQSAGLRGICDIFIGECGVRDDLQEEMLRIILKRFIITCTRIAREKYSVSAGKEKGFDIVRRFYVLVDNHFKEKKQVADYADMLCRSPKTLSNLFSGYGLPPPLKVIHGRCAAEARRLLLYTDKSAKEIGDILGFGDLAAFSRFFKKTTGKNITDYRKSEKRE